MTDKTLKTLEFDKILNMLGKCSVSSKAKHDILNIKPTTNKAQAELLLNQTEEADKVLYEYAVSPNFAVDDISHALERAEILATLTMGELLKVSHVLSVARNVKSSILKVPNLDVLNLIINNIFTNKTLEEEIDAAIISETEMSDNASTELREIRGKIRRCNDNIRCKLNEFITSTKYQKYLQDNIITIRSDRYVIPVRAEFKGAISGLVHDQSASGQTVYIEPMQVVELNNDLKTLILAEAAEIEKILRAFTVKVCNNLNGISCNFSIITELDIIFARAKFARDTKSVKPVINEKGYINIEKGRHPLINAEKVVPTSIYLGKDFDILLITGPNTGGKTVALKLTGLFVLMALSGLFLPATFAEISTFDSIFCDIGDEQSIEQSLSTFSSHIKNIINIIDNFTNNSLLLFDELGAGTDPTEGAVLAVAITKYIKNTKAKAVITSHFNDLKEFAIATDRVENACMDFDATTFAPTFHLTIGAAGASNALHIAKRLGLKSEILDVAESLISEESKQFNNILLSAERARQQAEVLTETALKNKAETEQALVEAKSQKEMLQKRADQINDNIRKETKKLIDNSMSEAEDIIEEMKGLLKMADDKALFEARRLKKKLEQMSAEYVDDTDFDTTEIIEDDSLPDYTIGEKVYYKPLKVIGTIENISQKGEISLKIGAVSSKVKANDCCRVKIEKTEKKNNLLQGKSELHNSGFKTELMLIGFNCDEGIYELDNFLDLASLHGVTEVRIVHGKGMGVLRKAVQAHLKGHPHVKSFRDGQYGEGDRGVTVVTLK